MTNQGLLTATAATKFHDRLIHHPRQRGSLASKSKIGRGIHEGLSHQMHPNSIGKDTVGKRIGRRHDGLSQFFSSATLFECSLLWVQELQETAWYPLAQLIGVSPEKNPSILRLVIVDQRHGTIGSFGRIDKPLFK